ncbi:MULTISPECIES: tetratricopeptide repeat protein [Filomicrobium]|nr:MULTISPECIES: tetratricopeptide repeat protein [Filomicrobium]MCV0370297.1 tetratricopeptide repeat protein [Filomicrobium sp.]
MPGADLLGEATAFTRPAPKPAQDGVVTEKELAEATGYWGERYAKAPTDLEVSLNYAKNLKAMGRKQQALAVLQQSGMFHADSRELAGEYGRLALDLGQMNVAEKLLAFADDPAKPDWRVISARGTVLAKQGKYAESIPYFDRALTLKQNHPSLLNNLALAHAMTGDANKAEGLLRQAADAGASEAKIRQNLALVLGLQGKYQESTQIASRDMPADTAAADTAYLRKLTQLAPVAPSKGGDVQVAKVQFKGSALPNDALSGWNSQVVAADARQ